MRKCLTCSSSKPVADYYDYEGRRASSCKACTKARSVERYQVIRNPEAKTQNWWRPEEDLYLKANYDKLPTFRIAKHLRRTQSSIEGRAHTLGLHKPHNLGRRPTDDAWSEGELSKVRQLYPTVPTRQLATQLHRTESAVQQCATRLGLKKTVQSRKPQERGWKVEEITQLRKLWPYYPTRYVIQHLERTKDAVVGQAKKLGLVKLAPSEGQKLCQQCWQYLPISSFTIAKNRPDGHTATCRMCESLSSKRRRATPEYQEWKKLYTMHYRTLHLDRLRAEKRQHYRDSPAQYKARAAARRARKMGTSTVEVIYKSDIIERDKSICYLCGNLLAVQDVVLEHVVPLVRGGTHTPNNVRVACSPCNLRKGRKLLSELDWYQSR